MFKYKYIFKVFNCIIKGIFFIEKCNYNSFPKYCSKMNTPGDIFRQNSKAIFIKSNNWLHFAHKIILLFTMEVLGQKYMKN